MSNWHAKETKEVIDYFSSHEDGLEENKVEERIEKYGLNKITQDDANHPVLIFFKQFRSGLVYVLIIAAFIAGIFNKWIDVYVILGVIVLNAVMGFVQEYKAEKAIRALRDMIVPKAKVYRGGELLKILAEKIVPGDVVLLEEGDKVPADIRILNERDLRISEASLTGESTVAHKTTEVVPKEFDLGDRKNMAWMGTFVTGGRGKGIVTETGDNTMFGSIAKDIGEIKKEGGHFQEKVFILTKRMAIFAFSGAFLIFLISLIRQGFLVSREMSALEEPLFASIAALVSGIPEGLPAILVIVLAVGATRMAHRNAIIRRLPATEALGVTDHIVSDKTGTITQNTMMVREIFLPEGDTIEVTGEGFKPEGDFYRESRMIIPLEERGLDKLLHIAEVCNEAELTHEKNKTDKYDIIGDPTEGALVVLAEKAGIKQEVIERCEEKIDDMPFSSKNKLRASLVKKEKGREVYVAGAPESLIERATKVREGEEIKDLTEKKKKRILAEVEKMSEKAMRTIALAYKKVEEKEEKITSELLEDLILTGVVGMADPPRKEVKEAVKRAHRAGIKVIMCTGDHKKTATAIAREVGILEKSTAGYPDALEEKELLLMTEEQFRKNIENVTVFARLTPHMKKRIAETLQKEGATIAMTGDGVNDAPAIKQADIGIAMGIMGTDVTKETGDIVLADDNFASIVNAIEEGRIVFENTRRSSSSLITSNFAEIGTLATFLLIGFPLPLLPTQILWVNLVTDGVVGVPLAMEPKHEDILKNPPRDKDETILVAQIIPYFALITVLMILMTFFVFNLFYEGGDSLEKARTGAFTVIAFTQLFNAVNLRSLSRSVFKIGFFSNKYIIIGFLLGVFLQIAVIGIPFLQKAFHFAPLSAGEIAFVALLTSFVLWTGEIYKYIHYRLLKKETA